MIDPDDAHDFLITMLQVIPTLLLAQLLAENLWKDAVRRARDAFWDTVKDRKVYGPEEMEAAAAQSKRLMEASQRFDEARERHHSYAVGIVWKICIAVTGFTFTALGSINRPFADLAVPMAASTSIFQISTLTIDAMNRLDRSLHRPLTAKLFNRNLIGILGAWVALFFLCAGVAYGCAPATPPGPSIPAPPATTTPLPAPPTD